MTDSDLQWTHFALCMGGLYFVSLIGLFLYIVLGNPSKEFMEELRNYHPPGHD